MRDTVEHAQPEAVAGIDPAIREPSYRAWMAANVTDLKRSIAGQRTLYWSLTIAFVLGLAFQAVGYLVKTSGPPEPAGLAADLLYALGWALWTGVVVVVFVEIIPRVKRRQIKRAIEAYEASVRRSDAERTSGSGDGDRRG